MVVKTIDIDAEWERFWGLAPSVIKSGSMPWSSAPTAKIRKWQQFYRIKEVVSWLSEAFPPFALEYDDESVYLYGEEVFNVRSVSKSMYKKSKIDLIKRKFRDTYEALIT